MLQQLTTDHVAKLGEQRARIGENFFTLIEVRRQGELRCILYLRISTRIR